MDQAVAEYEARSAKTEALLKLQKAKQDRDASRASLQRLKSERVVLGRVDPANAAAMDAQITAIQTQIDADEQNVDNLQRECNRLSCEPPTDVKKQNAINAEDQEKDKKDIAEQTSNILASNDDSLPIWAYVLIAVSVIGVVAGVAWYLTRSKAVAAPAPTSAPTTQPLQPTQPLAPPTANTVSLMQSMPQPIPSTEPLVQPAQPLVA